jgi:hypothetical protein
MAFGIDFAYLRAGAILASKCSILRGTHMTNRISDRLLSLTAVLVSLAIASAADAAIVAGSRVQFAGIAFIDGSNNIQPVDEGTGMSPPPPASILISTGALTNQGSFSGYNNSNPSSLPFAPNYASLMDSIPAAGPYGFILLQLPAVVIGSGEPGLAVVATQFRLDTWSVTTNGGFFLGQGTGRILDMQGGFLANGNYQFSAPGFLPGDFNTFSASLTVPSATTTIPLPGAAWIFGSGILAMSVFGRRKLH